MKPGNIKYEIQIFFILKNLKTKEIINAYKSRDIIIGIDIKNSK